MPILVSSAKSTPTTNINEVTAYAGNGIHAYSGCGTSHAAKGTPNEDAFLAAVVDEGMIPDAETAKETLRQLRNAGGSAISLLKQNTTLSDAGATLAAVTTYGDWNNAQANPDAAGFAVVCPGDSGIAWRDRTTGQVVQLTVAQETAYIYYSQHPISNKLGLSKEQGKTGRDQDQSDQVMAFSHSALAAELQKHGINQVDGEIIVFCDGIVQKSQTSPAREAVIQLANQALTSQDMTALNTYQAAYDEETKLMQARETGELYTKKTGVTNRAAALGGAAGNKGSNDDRTAIIIEMPPISGQQGQRIVYMCDGVGGQMGGWNASNAAVLAAGTRIGEMEQEYALKKSRENEQIIAAVKELKYDTQKDGIVSTNIQVSALEKRGIAPQEVMNTLNAMNPDIHAHLHNSSLRDADGQPAGAVIRCSKIDLMQAIEPEALAQMAEDIRKKLKNESPAPIEPSNNDNTLAELIENARTAAGNNKPNEPFLNRQSDGSLIFISNDEAIHALRSHLTAKGIESQIRMQSGHKASLLIAMPDRDLLQAIAPKEAVVTEVPWGHTPGDATHRELTYMQTANVPPAKLAAINTALVSAGLHPSSTKFKDYITVEGAEARQLWETAIAPKQAPSRNSQAR